MEPWENEEEKLAWQRALVPLGATEEQAEVAWLVRLGYRNGQIAALQRRSVSSVKEDVRILFAILNVPDRDRHVMGREAWRIVEGLRDGQHPAPRPRVALPELKLVKKRRPPSSGARRGRGAEEPPAREMPEV